MYQPSFVIPLMKLHHEPVNTPSYLFSRRDGTLLRGSDGVPFSSIPSELSHLISHQLFIGDDGSRAWYACCVSGSESIPGFSLVSLRDLPGLEPDLIIGVACRAVQRIRFESLNRFCGFCGVTMKNKVDEHAKLCPGCGNLVFPKISPAVIVRITDGSRILLSRSPHFPGGMYSVQAGFVEPGESLEAAVHREVLEEIGIRITDLSYFGSQPWPFPDSLMIGFTARYLDGDIRVDGVEIEEAGWYTAECHPALPGTASIAYAMIQDWFLNGIK